MTRASEHHCGWLAIVLVAAVGHVEAAQPAAQAGVVVEEVSKGSAGDKAGLRAGDVLLAWERAGQSARECAGRGRRHHIGVRLDVAGDGARPTRARLNERRA
jgi:S1-C subfamily serine protease